MIVREVILAVSPHARSPQTMCQHTAPSNGPDSHGMGPPKCSPRAEGPEQRRQPGHAQQVCWALRPEQLDVALWQGPRQIHPAGRRL